MNYLQCSHKLRLNRINFTCESLSMHRLRTQESQIFDIYLYKFILCEKKNFLQSFLFSWFCLHTSILSVTVIEFKIYVKYNLIQYLWICLWTFELHTALKLFSPLIDEYRTCICICVNLSIYFMFVFSNLVEIERDFRVFSPNTNQNRCYPIRTTTNWVWLNKKIGK